MRNPQGSLPVNVLVLDIGGSNVKLRMTGQSERTKIPTGPDYTPKQLVADIGKATRGWDFEAVTVGFPAPVTDGQIPFEPKNLGRGWVDFRFEKAFGKPVKLVNDAAMQAVGCYEGGRMLFLSLGTGLGSALIADHHVIGLELSELRWSKQSTLEDRVGKASILELGRETWEESVHDTVALLRAAFLPDSIVIGGGGARLLKKLPKRTQRGHNDQALRGGELLWTESRFRI
jgi:predicted NBD/HSP70 family sugar kinase